nr:unnamed protein product [Callosobruchus analis]
MKFSTVVVILAVLVCAAVEDIDATYVRHPVGVPPAAHEAAQRNLAKVKPNCPIVDRNNNCITDYSGTDQ